MNYLRTWFHLDLLHLNEFRKRLLAHVLSFLPCATITNNCTNCTGPSRCRLSLDENKVQYQNTSSFLRHTRSFVVCTYGHHYTHSQQGYQVNEASETHQPLIFVTLPQTDLLGIARDASISTSLALIYTRVPLDDLTSYAVKSETKVWNERYRLIWSINVPVHFHASSPCEVAT